MATAKQRTANRMNARRSTGPRTQAGKERSRFNAIQHGLAAHSPVLPHENAVAFHEMRAALIAHHQPANIQELQLIDHIAHAQLRMERSRRFENGMFDLQLTHVKTTHGKPADPRADDDTGIAACMCSPEFDLGYKVLLRYDSRAESSYFKAVNALHRVQQARFRRAKTEAKQVSQTAESVAQTPKLASFGQTATAAPEPVPEPATVHQVQSRSTVSLESLEAVTEHRSSNVGTFPPPAGAVLMPADRMRDRSAC